MPAFLGNKKVEEYEWISNADLVNAAHLVMGGIELDPASSDIANQYVQAKSYYTVTDDGLNDQDWWGNVYLFPPNYSYFWHTKNQRWQKTRSTAKTLISGYSLWWKVLKKKWLTGEIKQGIFFCNCPDMFRYSQDIFDHPVCILRTTPTLNRYFYTSKTMDSRNTCTSFLVYLQPKDDVEDSTERFQETYSIRGRILL
jgi:hypothetical protein